MPPASAGDTLTMRRALSGEQLAALDGREYKLDESMTVIADPSGPLAIGGVIGGEATGCQPCTTEVFLEVALFDPVAVAKTGRQLNLISDARYRFERGVDPQSAYWGAEVAARLITEICGGEASEIVSAGELPPPRSSVSLRATRVADFAGVDIAPAEQSRILGALGFDVDEKDGGRKDVFAADLAPRYRWRGGSGRRNNADLWLVKKYRRCRCRVPTPCRSRRSISASAVPAQSNGHWQPVACSRLSLGRLALRLQLRCLAALPTSFVWPTRSVPISMSCGHQLCRAC